QPLAGLLLRGADGDDAGVRVVQLGDGLGEDAAVADGAREGVVPGLAVPDGKVVDVPELALRVQRAGDGGVVQGAVEEAGVRWVVVALHGLEVVALQPELAHVAVAGWQLEPVELGERGLLLRRAHVGPDDVGGFDAGVAGDLDLVAVGVALGGRWEVDALTEDVELPAVVDAAQAVFFVAAEEEGRAAVRAVRIQESGAALGVTEGDELLAQDGDADWL